MYRRRTYRLSPLSSPKKKSTRNKLNKIKSDQRKEERAKELHNKAVKRQFAADLRKLVQSYRKSLK